jgi:4-hydroxybenzoate polyprenyltransferase
MKKLIAFREFTRLQYVPFALTAIYSGYLLANRLDLLQLFFSSLSFTFLYIYMSSDNFYNDVKYDKVSVRTHNPILSGEITLLEARLTRIVGAVIAIVTSFFAGWYWMASVLIGIGIIILYQSQRFGLKHTPFGTFLIAFQSSIPFLFAYFNGVNAVALGLPIMLITIFLQINLTTALYHIADMEGDKQVNSKNFTVQYGVNATKKLEVTITLLTITLALVIVALNYVSFLMLPIVFVTTLFKLRIITQPLAVLKDPLTWGKYAPTMVINVIALFVGTVGTIVLDL